MVQTFVPLAEGFYVSPQIALEDLAAAKARGVSLIINNRPDGEEWGQISGAEIEAAAKVAGLDYAAIPVTAVGLSAGHLDAFDEAVASAKGAVLAYCRSGMRSTVLRAVARARAGDPIDAIIAEAANAGYNIARQRALLDRVKPRA